jgi:CMP/dCMP kinase
VAVRAIRGATTVESNDTGEIIEQTRVLLEDIAERNQLGLDDIISVIFTVTKDLNAAFPAVAARQIGWTDIALMCMNEIDVPGSLQKCIRVMVHCNTEKRNNEILHVYQNGAVVLRPDLKRDEDKMISIAIDGPSGAGKSTMAKIISKALGIVYLDTGAMYRAVALKAIREGIDTKDRERLAQLVKDIDIRITYTEGEQHIFLDGENIGKEIRTPQISIGASDVSAVPEVRIKLVELQREIAQKSSVVMDGRDIGTYVLPNAELKIFLTASVEDRARRRYEEQLQKGMTGISLEDVMKDMEYRDKNDSSRAFAPLKKAEDAIEINTTDFSIEQSAEKIMSYVKLLGGNP